MTCKNCIHDGVCYLQEITVDIDKQLREFGCKDFKNKANFAEIKYGEWVKRQKIYGIGYEYICSVCEKGIRHYEEQPICSECGAKMDGDK